MIELWASRMNDPMMIAGLAMICTGALLAALIVGLAPPPGHRGAPRHAAPERTRPMRIRRPDTEILDRDLAAAVDTLAFAHQWAPYGGAEDGEILMTFGLTPLQFAQRLRHAATHSAALDHLDFSPTELAQLHAYIQQMTVFPRPGDTPRVV